MFQKEILSFTELRNFVIETIADCSPLKKSAAKLISKLSMDELAEVAMEINRQDFKDDLIDKRYVSIKWNESDYVYEVSFEEEDLNPFNIMSTKDMKGKEGVILTCGPSLSTYSYDLLKEYCQDKVLLVVKSAIVKAPSSPMMFHFINSSHIPNNGYDYHQEHLPFIIASENDPYTYQKILSKQKHNVYYPVARYTGIENTICKNINPDDWTFDKRKDRPCGPGIMFETVFFFVQYLGLSRLTLFGWDGYPPDAKQHHHFYDIEDTNRDTRDTFVAEHNNATHLGGRKIYYWLKSHGCEMQIAGESYQHEEIPRIKL